VRQERNYDLDVIDGMLDFARPGISAGESLSVEPCGESGLSQVCLETLGQRRSVFVGVGDWVSLKCNSMFKCWVSDSSLSGLFCGSADSRMQQNG
jgi:hypothetical protein